MAEVMPEDQIPSRINVLLRAMKAAGNSLVLSWGEDTGLWECSWITSGKRYVGVSRFLDLAIQRAWDKETSL
jgi:hypothetical protein